MYLVKQIGFKERNTNGINTACSLYVSICQSKRQSAYPLRLTDIAKIVKPYHITTKRDYLDNSLNKIVEKFFTSDPSRKRVKYGSEGTGKDLLQIGCSKRILHYKTVTL